MNERSKQVRRDAIKLAKQYGGTHFGGSLSCIEILITLYDQVLKKDDLFILSKGHGCWGYYVLLREKGYIPKIENHPHIDVRNGIYCTTGSLGHGFPFGIGVALAKRIKNETGKVFVLMGDGECQEGTTWESLLIASKKKISNLVVIVDRNQIQGDNFTDNIAPFENLSHIIKLLDWNVHIVDGHNSESLFDVLNIEATEPTFIIANTVKGKGVSFMENKLNWHSKVLTDELEAKALEELQ